MRRFWLLLVPAIMMMACSFPTTIDNKNDNRITVVVGDTTHKGAPADTTHHDSTSGVTTAISVTPSSLNLLIAQSNQLTATVSVSSGTVPTPTWVAVLGCVQLSTTTGNVVTVTAVRACRDSVVATANGAKDFSIVTVTSGVSSIDYTPPGGTLAVGSTQNLTATCVLASGANCTPYWYSKDPSRFTVVGAPSVIVINGTTWPAGPTATIKAVWHGTTEICVQAAVQDQTILKCHTWTAP